MAYARQVACFNLFMVLISITSTTTNHWILKEGRIQPQYDSPFYMQKPDDIFSFLNQSKYQELIDSLYSELVLIKTDLRAKLGEVETYALGFLQQTKCMMQYFLEESDLLPSIGQRAYMDRIYRAEPKILMETSEAAGHLDPKCGDYLDLEMSLFCFEHLDAMYERRALQMDPEDPLKLQELGLLDDQIANILVTGLQRRPNWQFYTLASYYWRLRGDAKEAVECARRAVYLSPVEHRDIPLLSLGTIFLRARRHRDSQVVLEAATDFNGASENFFALGNSLFFLSEFNRSMLAYDVARQDEAFKARVDYIENALLCFKYAKTKLDRFDGLLVDISDQLRRYEDKKVLLQEYLKKMLQQQVPLDAREYFKRGGVGGELGAAGDLTANENLAELAKQRGQYCSTRLSPDTNEPVLFCDFVYDIHMKLESDDISVELIHTYLEQTREVMKTAKGSLGVFDHLDVNKLTGERFISDKFVPPDAAGEAGGVGGSTTPSPFF